MIIRRVRLDFKRVIIRWERQAAWHAAHGRNFKAMGIHLKILSLAVSMLVLWLTVLVSYCILRLIVRGFNYVFRRELVK
jgi:hypothetical protein